MVKKTWQHLISDAREVYMIVVPLLKAILLEVTLKEASFDTGYSSPWYYALLGSPTIKLIGFKKNTKPSISQIATEKRKK